MLNQKKEKSNEKCLGKPWQKPSWVDIKEKKDWLQNADRKQTRIFPSDVDLKYSRIDYTIEKKKKKNKQEVLIMNIIQVKADGKPIWNNNTGYFMLFLRNSRYYNFVHPKLFQFVSLFNFVRQTFLPEKNLKINTWHSVTLLRNIISKIFLYFSCDPWYISAHKN